MMTKSGNGVWIAKKSMWRLLVRPRHDCLFLAAGRLRVRMFLTAAAKEDE